MLQLEELQIEHLFNGEHFEFSNEQWCNENQSDDIREGFIGFNEKWELFMLFFNGQSIGTFRTMNGCKNRAKKLFAKWNLKPKH